MPPQPKPRKPGRPKLSKGEAKGKIVPVRFADDDLKKIVAVAKSRNVSLSQWIRETLNAAV
jgi:predicted HicB family RNase H-like nuclease